MKEFRRVHGRYSILEIISMLPVDAGCVTFYHIEYKIIRNILKEHGVWAVFVKTAIQIMFDEFAVAV